jgi:transcriptional antiterminator NusG
MNDIPEHSESSSAADPQGSSTVTSAGSPVEPPAEPPTPPIAADEAVGDAGVPQDRQDFSPAADSAVTAGGSDREEVADGQVADGADADVASDPDPDDPDSEPEDPFSGSEDAAPVWVGEDVEAEAGDKAPAEALNWYILKVQSNREDSIRETLLRRVKMQGLDRFFGEVVVPKEQVTEFKGGKKRVVSRKLYPGYILVNMVLNDETWYLVRETGGIGDFTGSSGRPSPMLPQDVAKLLRKSEEKTEEAPRLKINFKKGDRVKINEGTFENFEGEVDAIDEANGRVTVMLSIFGRSTPVDIEYWQIEST